jgi:hypothetical protein
MRIFGHLTARLSLLPSTLLLALSAPHAVHAQAASNLFQMTCPPTLPKNAVPTRDHAGGWIVSSPGAEDWSQDDSGMLHGAPDGQAYLVPDVAEDKTRGDKRVSLRSWKFSLPHGHEKWLYCGYGPVQLAHRIPSGATECSVRVEFHKGQRVPTIFTCK